MFLEYMEKVFALAETAIDLLSPYMLEIILGLLLLTFFIGIVANSR